MKILHIITSLKIGGAEVALLNMLRGMQDDKDIEHVVVCFYPGPLVALIRELGINVIVNTGVIRGYDLLGIIKLIWIVKKYQPDLLHASLWAANMVSRLLGKLFKIPVINELHGYVGHEGLLRNFFERSTIKYVQRIVAVSPSVRSSYERYIINRLHECDREYIKLRLMVICNGIDRHDLIKKIERGHCSRRDYGLTDEHFIVGAIGRFEKIKSYDVLIRAVAAMQVLLTKEEFAKIRVIMVGSGSLQKNLELLVNELGLKKQVIFTGYQMGVYRFYPLFDCFALSSQSEGLSIALLEALALGVPVISTHSSATHDAIIQGENGYLVPSRDVKAYSYGLTSLFHKEIEKNKNFKPLTDFQFSLDRLVKSYRTLYQDLVLQND